MQVSIVVSTLHFRWIVYLRNLGTFCLSIVMASQFVVGKIAEIDDTVSFVVNCIMIASHFSIFPLTVPMSLSPPVSREMETACSMQQVYC